MFDAHDRRSAIRKFAASARAVATTLSGMASARAADPASAGKKHRNKGKRPTEIWKGTLLDAVYTPSSKGDGRWIITGLGGQNGSLRHMSSGRKVGMTGSRLFGYIERKSGGKMNGGQCLRLHDINWRILGVEYDKPSNRWRLDVKLCESNPNAVPPTTTAAAGPGAQANINDTAEGCKCGCDESCYHCRADAFYYRANKYYCGINYDSACN